MLYVASMPFSFPWARKIRHNFYFSLKRLPTKVHNSDLQSHGTTSIALALDVDIEFMCEVSLMCQY